MGDKANTQAWNGESVRSLRRHLDMSQAGLAGELGTRQQTISEWETGLYAPRGISRRMLSLLAERASFTYGERQAGSGEGDGRAE
ncbi:MAG: helix-turn-helix domain-containing protein [Chloroflexi bacterium]|nr:helix-turn-helix domain-containing protein [Chloroflexota bacterium]